MKFQELLFDNQGEIENNKLSQILSELDLMVGSEIDEFGWFLTDYFDDPEEFSNNIEVFSKDDVIRMLNTLAKDENSDEIFSDILHGLEFVEVDEPEDLDESEDEDEDGYGDYDLNIHGGIIYLKGKVIFDTDKYTKKEDIETIANDLNDFALNHDWGNVATVNGDGTVTIEPDWFMIDNEEVTENEFRKYAKQSILAIFDDYFSNSDEPEELQDFIKCFVHGVKLNEEQKIVSEIPKDERLMGNLQFIDNCLSWKDKVIFDVDKYTKYEEIEIIANDFNDYAQYQERGGDVATVTDDCTVIIDPKWFITDDEEITEGEFREYAKQILISIIESGYQSLDFFNEDPLRDFVKFFVHGVKLNEAPNINPANKSTQKAKFRKKINRAWNAHSKSYNKAHAVKNRVERIANGTARKQKRYGKVYKRRLSLARKNRSNLTKRKARFSRIRPKAGFGTNQAKQNLKH